MRRAHSSRPALSLPRDLPSPTRVLTVADVHSYVDEQVFGTPATGAGDGQVGIELEWIAVAHDGDEALVLFETVKPALVLLDVMMPGRDGWEVCRIMKQHPLLGRSVRIIMVTALDEWQDKREALQLGADDYVEKPFDLPTLAATVQRNLAMQRAKAS